MAADSGAVQRTLSAFFLGLAVAQIPFGWLGDRFGRRRPLIGGFLLFAITSAGCALARNLDQLVLLRFLQGMAACAGTSSVRAMIRDAHSGHRAARLMAFTFLIIGISPVLALWQAGPSKGTLFADPPTESCNVSLGDPGGRISAAVRKGEMRSEPSMKPEGYKASVRISLGPHSLGSEPIF